MPTSQPTHRDLTRQTLGGLVWIGGGKVVYAGLRLLVLAIMARLLSPADFGIVGAALVVVGFSAIFSQLGLAPAIVQRPVLERRHLEAAFSASVLLGLLLGVLLWVSAPFAARFFHIAGVEPVLRVLAWIFPLDGLSAIAESQVQRELRFRWLATMEVLTFVLGYGVVGVVLALLGAGVWALVTAQMAQTALYTIILVVTRPPALRLLPDRAALGELMYYGGGFTASKIANYFALQVDNLVVGRWLGAAALGFYGRAYELMAGPPHLLGDAVDRVLFPAMASIQTDTRRLADAYRRGVALMGLIMLPASLVLFIVAPELILAMLGPRWTAVVTPFQILALGMFLRTSYRISDVTARATAAVYHRVGHRRRRGRRRRRAGRELLPDGRSRPPVDPAAVADLLGRAHAGARARRGRRAARRRSDGRAPCPGRSFLGAVVRDARGNGGRDGAGRVERSEPVPRA